MQTILGGGGAIGVPLAKELSKFTNEIKIVSRNAKKVSPSDLIVNADLRNKEEVIQAIKGSKVVYLVAGLKYTTKVWQKEWPLVMENVIEGCKRAGAKLVFFDNVYMYGRVEGPMTENTPFNPCSKKGEIRAQLNIRLMDEYKKGEIQAAIVRGADFYGPGISSSVFNLLVIGNLKKGKKANWFNNAKALHTFTYTPDAAYATALIGNTESAFNQVWHAPSVSTPVTGEEMIKIASQLLGVEPRIQVLGDAMLFMAGLFNPTIMSMIEMTYQFKYDYIFNSDKFKKAFEFSPTSYRNGIKACIDAAK
ncbi:SDR family oxidoreductase [Ignavibacteriales bacterium]